MREEAGAQAKNSDGITCNTDITANYSSKKNAFQ